MEVNFSRLMKKHINIKVIRENSNEDNLPNQERIVATVISLVLITGHL